jgi:hypothetical protein
MNKRRRLEAPEVLESRLCLASSLGWDGSGRGAAALTYSISGSVASLGAAATQAALQTALNAWSAVARVTFTPTSTPGLSRSIDFSFGNIDGPGGTLAVGYYPNDLNREPVAGDIQFDASESWEVGNGRGSAAFDLVLTAVHEIGHALGLDHSSTPGSIMADTVSASQSYSGLNASDVTAIRGLYAANGATTPTTSPTTPTSTTPTIPITTTTTTPRFPTLTLVFWFRRPRLSGRLTPSLGARGLRSPVV